MPRLALARSRLLSTLPHFICLQKDDAHVNLYAVADYSLLTSGPQTLATIERTLAPAAAPLQLQLGNAQPVANLFSTGPQALQLGGTAGFSGGRDSYYEAQGSVMYGFQGTILPQTLPYGHGTEYGLSGAPQLGSSILPPGGRAYQAGWFGSVPQHPQSAFPSTAPSAGAGAELRSLLGILAQQQQTSALGAADPEGAPRGQFTSAALRAPHAGVVHSLYAAQPMQCPTTGRRFRDQATFTRHIDAMYLKQRAAQEAANASRRWFVSSEARSLRCPGVEPELYFALIATIGPAHALHLCRRSGYRA